MCMSLCICAQLSFAIAPDICDNFHLYHSCQDMLSVEGQLMYPVRLVCVMLITIGHNWGSPHDPTGDECAPDADHGGKYIMYWVSVSGQDANNEVRFMDTTVTSLGDMCGMIWKRFWCWLGSFLISVCQP